MHHTYCTVPMVQRTVLQQNSAAERPCLPWYTQPLCLSTYAVHQAFPRKCACAPRHTCTMPIVRLAARLLKDRAFRGVCNSHAQAHVCHASTFARAVYSNIACALLADPLPLSACLQMHPAPAHAPSRASVHCTPTEIRKQLQHQPTLQKPNKTKAHKLRRKYQMTETGTPTIGVTVSLDDRHHVARGVINWSVRMTNARTRHRDLSQVHITKWAPTVHIICGASGISCCIARCLPIKAVAPACDAIGAPLPASRITGTRYARNRERTHGSPMRTTLRDQPGPHDTRDHVGHDCPYSGR